MLQCRQDYKAAYLCHTQTPSNTATMAAYIDSHNNYVTQLHATNAMVDTYSRETLPDLLGVSFTASPNLLTLNFTSLHIAVLTVPSLDVLEQLKCIE